MYFYFSADFPAVLKINGVYHGTVFGKYKEAELIETNENFIEVLSTDGKYRSFNFILDENFISSPPENALTADLDGGYLILFKRRREENGLIILTQQNFGDAIVTVYRESGLKISIETRDDYVIDCPDTDGDVAVAERVNGFSAKFITVFLKGRENALLVYKTDKKIECVYRGDADSFSISDKLYVTKRKEDVAKHIISEEWSWQEERFTLTARNAKVGEDFARDSINEKILPYAFFEEVCAGGDYGFYLGQSAKENEEKIPIFLGEFIGVCPPPRFKDQNSVGLIYKKKENTYYVKYFICEKQNGKIINITPV